MGSPDITFYLEKEMAVMMILVVVFMVVGGPGGHMGLHGTKEPSTQSSQPHEHDAAKPRAEKPDAQEKTAEPSVARQALM